VLCEDRGDYVRAERCLRQVLDTNPNHERARLFMKDVMASKDMVVEEDHDRDILKRRALLDTPVTDFELSVRARTCLKKMNIRTLGDLLRITETELMSYKNFGESSLEEIKKMLAMKGLRLGQGLEDAHRSARRQIMERLKGSGKEALLNKPVGRSAALRPRPQGAPGCSTSRRWATCAATPRPSSWASRTSAPPRSPRSTRSCVVVGLHRGCRVSVASRRALRRCRW
jgi:hypothetical protein